MAARYQRRTPIHTPDLSLSDSEDSYSSDEEEMPDREETDQLLRQAHHYVITEGGNDSPTTYVERIQRINRSLIQEIAQHSYDCDPKLYRRVKQKIDHVLREFEDAVDADFSIYEYDEMPEYYMVAAKDALYRIESSPVTSDDVSARRSRHGKQDFERTYLYGGPNTHAETWYHKAAASLPFPETVRVADWESLRIHWDLENTSSMEKTEPVTGNGISFNDPRLAHHNSLPRYESGSRFRLPATEPSVIAEVEKVGTINNLSKIVADFNQGDDSKKNDGAYKYAPRVFLDRFDVGQEASPEDLVDDVRSAVNTTPTKPHSNSSGSSKVGSASPATRILLDQQQQASTTDASSRSISTHENEDLPVTNLTWDCEPHITSSKLFSRGKHVSPAIQRIKAATEDSIRSSPLPQSPPAHPETTQTQIATATHMSIPTKRDRGRPHKNTLPGATNSKMPAYQTTTTGKRKRLSIDAVVEAGSEAVDDVELPAKRMCTSSSSYQGRYKSIQELRREPSASRPCTPTMVKDLKTPALTPASVGISVASTPPVAKARTAGEQKCRPKRCYE